MEEYVYEDAYILGNGFDIALGYPTRFADYCNSKLFTDLVDNNNQLAIHIQHAFGINNFKWVDVEIEIGKYSKSIENKFEGNSSFISESERFRNEYNDLCKSLYKYICRLNTTKSGRINKKVVQLCEDWINHLCGNIKKKALFITFNYHPIDFNLILQYDFLHDHLVGSYPHFVHGKVNLNEDSMPNIVLGVDVDSIYCKQHPFIVKKYIEHTNALPFTQNIQEAKNITIFGCSIGNTDKYYFKQLFENAKNKNFTIYCHGADELCNIKANIDNIRDLVSLMSDNNVMFKDSTVFDFD